MKKIVFLLLLLIVPVCAVGCGDNLSETYWIDCSQVLQEYFANDASYNEVKNIQYNKNIATIMAFDYGAEYKELNTVYKVLFNSSMAYASNYCDLLQNNPQVKNKQFKQQIKNVNKYFNNFKDQVQEFINKKNAFNEHVNFTEEQNVLLNTEQAILLKYKQDYLKLIKSAYNISEALFKATRIGYYDFYTNNEQNSEIINKSNMRIAVHSTNLGVMENAIEMLELYNNLDKYQGYSKYWNMATDYYTNVVVKYDTNLLNQVEDLNVSLNQWKAYYDMFIEDEALYENIKKEINFEKLIEEEHDSKNYSNELNRPELKNKINYFMQFHNEIDVLINYTKALFKN